MKTSATPGVLLVATREIRWIVRDRVALFLIVGVPLIAFAMLSWIFSNAVVRELRVAVVDMDHSATSLSYVQAISAAPSIDLAERSPNLSSAMHAIRSGEALAAVFIPPNFERDIANGRRPQIVAFYNRQYFTPGNIASSGLNQAITAETDALAAARKPSAPTTAGPLVVEQYVLSNPALNYAQFLLRAILPTVLHVVMTISAVYAMGSEFGRRNRRAWLRTAGGSPSVGLVGKLLPLFGVFILQMVVGLGLIHGVFQIPFRGDPVIMVAAALLFVLCYLSIGALLPLLARNLALGLSLAGLVCSPAFGYAGIGFPTTAMNGFARGWGDLLPLRWYIQVLFDQAARGLTPSTSLGAFMTLGFMAILFPALAWFRLRAVLRMPEKREAESPERVRGPGVSGAFVAEWRRVLADRGVFGLMVLAPVIYGVFYPQPYLTQLVRDVPIAIVDQDRTELSRSLIQTIDADEAVKVAVQPDTIEAADAAVQAHQVYGILAIPPGTEREVLKGNPARLPAFVDSAYFLVFNRMVQGILESVGAVSIDTISHGARMDSSLAKAGVAKVQPAELLLEPLYNPVGGYASYVVPAAFILILQQTLLMGSATLGGVAYERGAREGRTRRSGPAAVLGQGLAHFCIYLPALMLYLVLLPRVYGFSTLGRIGDLFLVAIPFILAVSFLGQLVGSTFKRRETAILAFLASSLPLFFMVGVSWPREAIPPAVQDLSRIFPSTSGIDALVRINQMGASLADVRHDWLILWFMAVFYFAMTVGVQRFMSRRASPRTAEVPA
ncbi:MAG TPA: ABC transporter permease [Candidatus Cybelea sp.]|nr:ABC transporter permease [Candidatus Cybelea sp.]